MILVSLNSTRCLAPLDQLTADIVIAFIRSKAVYQEPLLAWRRNTGRKKRSYPCAADLFAATADMSSINLELPSDRSECLCCIVHFYARLLVLRCYEDYSLRHDTQPIELDGSDRADDQDPYLIAMHHRRLELVKLKQDLFAFLGPLAPEHKSLMVGKESDSADEPYRRKLRSLLTDVEMLLSLYDNTMRIYEWHVHVNDSNRKAELASEQLEEAKESKATAISLGKFSNLAFLYLLINFVCAMLGHECINLWTRGSACVGTSHIGSMLQSPDIPAHLPIYSRRAKNSALQARVLPCLAFCSRWILVSCLLFDPRLRPELRDSVLWFSSSIVRIYRF